MAEKRGLWDRLASLFRRGRDEQDSRSTGGGTLFTARGAPSRPSPAAPTAYEPPPVQEPQADAAAHEDVTAAPPVPPEAPAESEAPERPETPQGLERLDEPDTSAEAATPLAAEEPDEDLLQDAIFADFPGVTSDEDAEQLYTELQRMLAQRTHQDEVWTEDDEPEPVALEPEPEPTAVEPEPVTVEPEPADTADRDARLAVEALDATASITAPTEKTDASEPAAEASPEPEPDASHPGLQVRVHDERLDSTRGPKHLSPSQAIHLAREGPEALQRERPGSE